MLKDPHGMDDHKPRKPRNYTSHWWNHHFDEFIPLLPRDQSAHFFRFLGFLTWYPQIIDSKRCFHYKPSILYIYIYYIIYNPFYHFWVPPFLESKHRPIAGQTSPHAQADVVPLLSAPEQLSFAEVRQAAFAGHLLETIGNYETLRIIMG